MARYALLHDEVNDYVSYSNANMGVASGADVTIGTFIKVPDNSGSRFKYFISNGSFTGAGTFNAYISEGDQNSKINIAVEEGSMSVGPFNWSTEKCVIYQRSGGAWSVWVGDTGEVLTNYPLLSSSSSLNSSGWETGRRADGNPDRHHGGNLSRFWKANRAVTQAEADDIASGTNPATVLGSDIVANYLFDEGAGDTVNDTESANTGTLNNFPIDDSEWILVSGTTGPATPINLGVTNLQATSARLTWEQG